jgi:hypothetical protein
MAGAFVSVSILLFFGRIGLLKRDGIEKAV